MTPAEVLTNRLVGGRWRGSYGEALCPIHDDRSPRRTIRDGDKSPLVKCHRGCDPRQIVTALRRRRHGPTGPGGEPRVAPTQRKPAPGETLADPRGRWRNAKPIN